MIFLRGGESDLMRRGQLFETGRIHVQTSLCFYLFDRLCIPGGRCGYFLGMFGERIDRGVCILSYLHIRIC